MKTLLALSMIALNATVVVAQSPILRVPFRVKRETKAIATVRQIQDTLTTPTTFKLLVQPRSDTTSETVPEPAVQKGLQSAATVAYNFASGGTGSDKLAVVAQVVLNNWNPDLKVSGYRFSIPIVGNLSNPANGGETAASLKTNAQELMGSAQGIYAGIMPTFSRDTNSRGYAARYFASASVRTNTVKDLNADTTFHMTNSRFSVGAQFDLGQFDQGTGTVGIELYNTRIGKSDFKRAFDSGKPRIWNGEIVAILPISEKLGILGQYLWDFTNKEQAWRMGVAIGGK